MHPNRIGESNPTDKAELLNRYAKESGPGHVRYLRETVHLSASSLGDTERKSTFHTESSSTKVARTVRSGCVL